MHFYLQYLRHGDSSLRLLHVKKYTLVVIKQNKYTAS